MPTMYQTQCARHQGCETKLHPSLLKEVTDQWEVRILTQQLYNDHQDQEEYRTRHTQTFLKDGRNVQYFYITSISRKFLNAFSSMKCNLLSFASWLYKIKLPLICLILCLTSLLKHFAPANSPLISNSVFNHALSSPPHSLLILQS